MLAEPLIPYITLPALTLVPKGALWGFPPIPLAIQPFGFLVAMGIVVASALTIARAKRIGLDERAMTSFITWVVGIGLLGGHVFDVLFYYPERLREDPWVLLRLWDGLSSFGGFTGAIIGMLCWRAKYRNPALPYTDNVMALLPVGWAFGRAGCSIAHDHPGVRSEAWLAVQYPGGGRYDLGLLELAFTLLLVAVFLWLGKRARPWGFFSALACLSYAPVRFALDFLREREAVPGDVRGAIDPRYGQLTPAQWECFLLLALGVVLLVRVLRQVQRGRGFEPAAVPDAFRRPAPSPSDAQA
jgi:phosphatidylglycerol:prolipoprotein diacylglycerol transferase